MPRVTAAHEQEVRDRIIAAAVRVFSEKGYHSSTIADVCRESGLSVGAIYTYFASKEALFLQSCDLISARGLDELAQRLATATTTATRLSIAIGLFVETIDEYEGAPGQISLVQAWAEADREPGVREMLAARRERLVGAGQVLLYQGIASGELPAGVDVDAVTPGLLALLDGLLLQRIEAGDAYRPGDLRRRAGAIVDLLIPAASAHGRPVNPSPATEPEATGPAGARSTA